MAKFVTNAPIPVGHWNGEANPTFNIVATMGTIVLESIPASGDLNLVLPANPTTGDWYEFADPQGLIHSAQPLTVSAADGRKVQNEAALACTQGGCGGKLVFDADINMWCLISSNPCPFGTPAPPPNQ
jgi:hypothetical protein